MQLELTSPRRNSPDRHPPAATRPVTPNTDGCEGCLTTGDAWAHLRVCLSCGHVGPCDSSKNQHATAHVHATRHPAARTLEPAEGWAYCYEQTLL